MNARAFFDMVAKFVELDDLYERRGFVCDFLRMSKQKQKIKDEVYRIKRVLKKNERG